MLKNIKDLDFEENVKIEELHYYITLEPGTKSANNTSGMRMKISSIGIR